MAAHKRLNRDDLIATALATADAEGLEAVTIRRVAQEHDVTPMALYRHFADKEGLLDAVAESLLSSVRLPAPDDRPWFEQVEELLSGLLDSLRSHPNAAVLVLSRMFSCEAGLDLTERVLTQFKRARMDLLQASDSACHVLNSLVTLVIGDPALTVGDAEAQDAAARAKRAYLHSLPPRRYPHLVEAADVFAECGNTEAYYRRGVGMIVAGLRAMTAPQPAPA